MRKTISIFLAAVLVLSLMTAVVPGANAATGDEIRAAKKIISVVYDDSGSMLGNYWVAANYAMQALTALLNEQDEMYITYMSQPTVTKEVDLSDIHGAVEGIRNWDQMNNTPVEALDTARKKLDSITSSDPSTQYWLMILTDGAIENCNNLQSKLNGWKGNTMSNGTSLNVVYLAMGSAEKIAPDPNGGLFTDDAEIDEISNAMGQIANLISGRLSVDKVKQESDNTISFSSDLPLYSISILSQQSAAAVASAKTAEEDLHINRNVGLDAKDIFGYTSVTLVGNAAVLDLKSSSGDNKVIPAGTYSVTFTEPVDVNDLVVQYEPAIGIHPIITRDGVVVTDPATLALDEKVTIEIIPVIPGTDVPIDPDSLPKGVNWFVEYLVDGNLEDSGKGTKLTDVILKEGDNIIRGTMQIPGFAPSVLEIGFFIEEHIYDLGIAVEQPDPLTYYRHSAGDGSEEGTQIVFRITDGGTPLSLEDMEALNAGLKIASVDCDNSALTGPWDRFGKNIAQVALTQNDDGSYSLEPKAPLPFTAFMMVAGEYTVTVCLERDDAVTAEGTFTMVATLDDWHGLPGLVITILVFLYLLYILFIKHKFRGQTIYYEVYRLRNNRGVEDGAQAESRTLSFLSGGLLLPTRACRVKFYGLILEAGPGGTITVLGKSIAKQVYSYKQSSMDPERTLGTIVSSMRRTERKVGNSTEQVADDQMLSPTSPIYFRSDEGDNEIWRIYSSQ